MDRFANCLHAMMEVTFIYLPTQWFSVSQVSGGYSSGQNSPGCHEKYVVMEENRQ